VIFLAVHPPSTAATRLPAAQYRSAVAEVGLDLVVCSFFREADLADWFGPSQLQRLVVVLRALLRLPKLAGLLREATVVVVQREVMPLGPPLIELLAGRRRRLVWDVDDAIWQPYVSPTAGRVPRWLRAPGRKFERIGRRADEIWAGSEELARWCRRHNDCVRVVPTVVDVPTRRPPVERKRVVCWIGSHATGAFVEQALDAVARVEPPPRVLVVGANPTFPDGLDGEIVPWSLDEERRTLSKARVGLYPIDRTHPLADGKCGFKAVLYMSRGIPPVLTPTPANAAIVRDGVEGLHADDPDAWREAIQRLLDDDDLWERCSWAAYERARSNYSLDVWGPRIASILRDLSSAAPRGDHTGPGVRHRRHADRAEPSDS